MSASRRRRIGNPISACRLRISQQLGPPAGDHAGDLGADLGVVLFDLLARPLQERLDLVDLRVEPRPDGGRITGWPVHGDPEFVLAQR